MNQSNDFSFKNEKKLNLITTFLIAAGAIISVCLVFFFIKLYNAENESSVPKVFEAKQIGATDSSVLLSWSCSAASKDFIVRYSGNDSNETKEIRTDCPFAAIHGLEPYKSYTAVIIPVEDDTEYDAATVICNTSPYCHVLDVTADEITGTSARITWSYEGIDEGFTAAFYAVDKNGNRLVTSRIISIPKGSETQCTVDGLLSELNYTVCIMPDTKFAVVGKTTFLTDKYSRSYNRHSIIRFTTCTYDSTDSIRVNAVKNLNQSEPYKMSLLLSGKAESTDQVDMEMYITDDEGNIIHRSVLNNTFLNPDGKSPKFLRTFVTEFTAPSEPGNYSYFAAIDGLTVRKNTFKVI